MSPFLLKKRIEREEIKSTINDRNVEIKEKKTRRKGKSIQEVTEAVNQYSDLLFRICFLFLKSEEDVHDILQETFIRFMEKAPTFESQEHEKA